MDVFDQATAREELDRELALKRHAQRYPGATARMAYAPTHCADCGSPIPEARRAALPGVAICIGCQLEAERLARLYSWS